MASGVATSNRQCVRVLLLEDCAEDAELLSLALEAADFDVELERTSNQASFLDALQRQTPDIVLSDAALPCFSGEEALQLVRAHAPQVPFVLLSGYVEGVRARNPAVEACLGKEHLEQLPGLMRQLLARPD